MILLYRPIYAALKLGLKVFRSKLKTSDQNWLNLRNRPLNKKNNLNNTIWFHASSGELEYCKSIIRVLKKARPDQKIVVTYSSPSAEKLFYNIEEFVDEFIPLPWDQPKPIKELIHYIQPRLMLFSRTDLWPELIYQLRKRKIPIGLLTFTPRQTLFNRLIYPWLLADFNFISCTDYETRHFLYRLVPEVLLRIDGDTRFDQVFFRLMQQSRIQINSDQPFFVFGSTWPQDEVHILPNLNSFIQNNYSVILSPHNVSEENILRLSMELANLNLPFKLLSTLLSSNEVKLRTEILLIDKIGYLADCYRNASGAFVGGSFKDRVHSVMEPLCCGLKVLVGPFFKNNLEAIKYSASEFSYVHVVKDTEELKKIAFSLLNSHNASQKRLIKNEMYANTQSSENLVLHIMGLTQQTPN